MRLAHGVGRCPIKTVCLNLAGLHRVSDALFTSSNSIGVPSSFASASCGDLHYCLFQRQSDRTAALLSSFGADKLGLSPGESPTRNLPIFPGVPVLHRALGEGPRSPTHDHVKRRKIMNIEEHGRYDGYAGSRLYRVAYQDYGCCNVAAPSQPAAIIAAALLWDQKWQDPEFYLACRVSCITGHGRWSL